MALHHVNVVTVPVLAGEGHGFQESGERANLLLVDGSGVAHDDVGKLGRCLLDQPLKQSPTVASVLVLRVPHLIDAGVLVGVIGVLGRVRHREALVA